MEMRFIKEKNKKYVIDERRDLIIFNKIKKIEKMKLINEDKEVISLIKTQLQKDWRKYLINYLNKLEKKYKR